ncbi:MAG: transcriptional repressor [Eubacterium sp.]|jgi:Fur family peroxide stress response transcriptional regulator|nr:transcriptional repressor [Eubacterium sp.]MCI9618045.1 transcriptional repressor [Eubacterium sp.]
MTKRSLQRDLIKENLISRYDHPTADMVYHSIRQELPNISLGTVYRNLRFLVEQGDALSLKLGDGREHFDGHVQPHYHFICSKCGEIEDIFMKEPSISSEAAKHCSGEIQGHITYFYGLCANCKSRH